MLGCFVPNFKLKYEDSENIKTDLVNIVFLNLHRLKRRAFFWDSRYCCPMFVLVFVLSEPNFSDICAHFGTDVYFAEIHKTTTLISQCCLRVCVATSVLIQSNFKPDLICFTTHTINDLISA